MSGFTSSVTASNAGTRPMTIAKTIAVATAACGTAVVVARIWHHHRRARAKLALSERTDSSSTGDQTQLSRKPQPPVVPQGAADQDGGSEGAAVELEDLATSVGEARPEPLGVGEALRRLPQQLRQRRQQPRQGPPSSPKSVAQQPPESAQQMARYGDADALEPYLPGKQRVYVKTFGCPHNQSDGEYMMGQLKDYGYTLVDSFDDCDVCVVNSCTVKHPSEVRALNIVTKAQEVNRPVVLAGCVASSDKKLAESLEGVSMLDVSQLDRVVDVVEESLKGNTVKLLEKRSNLPSLALPKVRKDKLAEIITINAGCLGNCTYCKTKLARGKVVSYTIEEIIERALQAAAEGVCQIELASEDMGAYGIDIGTDIVQLLHRLSDALPPGVMLRTGMTNPPYILHHIDGIIEVLKKPNVHAFMHIPVQSGSDNVLQAMRREYTVAEFSYLVDRLKEAIPEIFVLTDLICGFPAESEEDWQQTMDLVRKYRFNGIHISQFYARPNTPAARLKPLKSHVPKDRYREVTDFITSYDRNAALLGREELVWFTGTDEEHKQTVGRTKAFAKIVVERDDSLLGRSAMVRIEQTNRLHAEGRVIGPSSIR